MPRLAASVLAALAITLAAGCAVQGPAFEQVPSNPHQGIVYLYRTWDVFGFTGAWVECGNRSIELGSGGYHPFVLDPQPLTCSVLSQGNSSVEFLVQAGQVYYVRESSFWGFVGPRFYLEIPDAGNGPDQIRNCKLQ
ncbi:MAG TPA: hypothetical protein VMH37_16100 [Candidatus Binataceae bacterium]|nr:hypothetical protein [Candidatus Binataceae bacterium]